MAAPKKAQPKAGSARPASTNEAEPEASADPLAVDAEAAAPEPPEDDASAQDAAEEPADTEPSASAKVAAGTGGAAGARPLPTRPVEPSVIGFGPGFFFEDTDIVEDRFENGQRVGNVDRQERVSESLFELQAWVLFPVLLERLRFGGGLAWYNAYTLALPEEENDDDLYEVGHTFQLFVQAEYVIADVASKLDVLFGLRGGGIIVFPGDDVQDRLDFLEGQQFDVIQAPRLGAFVGPHVGVIWPLNDRLALRADASVQFSKIGLYDAEAEEQGSLIEVAGHLNTTRTLLLVGLEFGL